MAQQEDDGHSETSSLIIAVSSPGPSLLVSGQTTLDCLHVRYQVNQCVQVAQMDYYG